MWCRRLLNRDLQSCLLSCVILYWTCSRVSFYYMNLIYRTIICVFSSYYQPLSIICSQRAWERPTDPDVITHYASSRPTYHSVPIPCCLEIRAMLVTSYSTHAPVNLWCEHVLFWSNDMKPKTTRGSRLSLQIVRLQSPVSNLNLLCHLKSPWTNLTLACNNRSVECLCVVCVSECVTTGLPALIMAL